LVRNKLPFCVPSTVAEPEGVQPLELFVIRVRERGKSETEAAERGTLP
jgi:hypothetical protein